MFPEWVDYIYIESSIFTNCTKWLLKFQNEHGSFMETDSYDKPLDAKMKANVSFFHLKQIININSFIFLYKTFY